MDDDRPGASTPVCHLSHLRCFSPDTNSYFYCFESVVFALDKCLFDKQKQAFFVAKNGKMYVLHLYILSTLFVVMAFRNVLKIRLL